MMNEVIDAIMAMLERKGVITEEQFMRYFYASAKCVGSDVRDVVDAISEIE